MGLREILLLFLDSIIVLFDILMVESIIVLGEGLTQGLDNATLTAEAKYPFNFEE